MGARPGLVVTGGYTATILIDEIGRGGRPSPFRALAGHGTQHATAKTTARVNDSTYYEVRVR